MGNMKKVALVIGIVLSSLMMAGTAVEARTVLSENELKDKITNNKISTLYLLDGAISGLEINQYGLVSGEVVVFGQYKKIPDDILKLASAHNVNTKNAEGYGSGNEVFSGLMWSTIPWFLNMFIFLGILIVLVLINRKLVKMLEIWNRKS
jgi:hypothetical protein